MSSEIWRVKEVSLDEHPERRFEEHPDASGFEERCTRGALRLREKKDRGHKNPEVRDLRSEVGERQRSVGGGF